MKQISALISGILFGVGLAVSGMTDTQKVLGFLDIFGHWDADLAFVMGAAVLTATVGFKLIFTSQNKPWFSNSFSLPLNQVIDSKLLLGAAIFGIGWGIYGYCPGPAMAATVYLSPTSFIFLAAMVLGLFIGNWVSKKLG